MFCRHYLIHFGISSLCRYSLFNFFSSDFRWSTGLIWRLDTTPAGLVLAPVGSSLMRSATPRFLRLVFRLHLRLTWPRLRLWIVRFSLFRSLQFSDFIMWVSVFNFTLQCRKCSAVDHAFLHIFLNSKYYVIKTCEKPPDTSRNDVVMTLNLHFLY